MDRSNENKSWNRVHENLQDNAARAVNALIMINPHQNVIELKVDESSWQFSDS